MSFRTESNRYHASNELVSGGRLGPVRFQKGHGVRHRHEFRKCRFGVFHHVVGNDAPAHESPEPIWALLRNGGSPGEGPFVEPPHEFHWIRLEQDILLTQFARSCDFAQFHSASSQSIHRASGVSGRIWSKTKVTFPQNSKASAQVSGAYPC